MTEQLRNDIRNVAIIAHVDHGKTTLVDAMLWQAARFQENGADGPAVLASVDPRREKAVTVMSRVTTIPFRGARINIVDTPARADFGGEVDRALKLADGVLLLVDAVEGPLPQTRFAVRKALEAGLAPIVILTKIDLPGARLEAVLDEVRALFADLDGPAVPSEFSVLYCNPLAGICRREPGGADESLLPLFELILETVPPPVFDPDGPLQFLVTMLDYDDYLGRLALGRVFNGSMAKGQNVGHCRLDGENDTHPMGSLFGFDGLRRVEVDRAGPGDIIAVSGLDHVAIGETLTDTEHPEPLPALTVGEPTITMTLLVNDSPMAGIDGDFVSGPKLRERLWREILTNAAIRVEETDSPDAFDLSGRDELQLAILIEMMRREGFELQVARPRVPTRDDQGQVLEPMEQLVLDCPEEFSAVVTEKAGARKGRLTRMVNHGAGRVHMEFKIPARGLIGFRTEFLNDTKGSGILHHAFDSFAEWLGDLPRRSSGALVADRPGRATAHAIEHLQPRGTIFVSPGDEVYEGMIVGENSRADDLQVNITKENRPTPYPVAVAAHAGRLFPPRSLSLEQALEFIDDDELVEVTPRAVRLRKRVLPAARRERNP